MEHNESTNFKEPSSDEMHREIFMQIAQALLCAISTIRVTRFSFACTFVSSNEQPNAVDKFR